MSFDSWMNVYVNGSRRWHYRSQDISEVIMFIFRSEEIETYTGGAIRDIVRELGLLDKSDASMDDPDYAINITRNKIKILRDRLKVIGYGSERMLGAYFDRVKVELIEELEDGPQRDQLVAFTFNSWRENLREIILDDHEDYEKLMQDEASVYLLNSVDERFAAAVVLSFFDDSDDIIVDVSEYSGEWFYDQLDRFDVERKNAFSVYCTPIIVTEGSMDVKIIKGAIEAVYPHLVDYVRFLDLDIRAESGASQVATMIKNFAATGLSNRILTVFDNDAIGHEAASKDFLRKLPKNFKVCNYPDTSFLKNYPTLGPQGEGVDDVNGRAGSIEMYLGADCLTLDNGKPMPITWSHYVKNALRYHGHLSDEDKKLAQKKFLKKVNEVKKGTPPNEANWNEMRELIESILDQLADLDPIDALQLRYASV